MKINKSIMNVYYRTDNSDLLISYFNYLDCYSSDEVLSKIEFDYMKNLHKILKKSDWDRIVIKASNGLEFTFSGYDNAKAVLNWILHYYEIEDKYYEEHKDEKEIGLSAIIKSLDEFSSSKMNSYLNVIKAIERL